MTSAAPVLSTKDYSDHVNPQWVRLLELLQMNEQYTQCAGVELHTGEGRTILDFLSGYCVHNAGHNHPYIVEQLQDELSRRGPAMLQSHVPDLAGELAGRLCRLAGGKLRKVFFACSGSEGVESAIKFSRAATGRRGLLYCRGAFHGLTCGALSLMGDEFWRERFGPMLPDTAAVPFNDLSALRERLATRQYAAFFVEPIQAEAGIRLPDQNYLHEAQQLCARYGTLLVLDEVQTGMYRTGRFLAAQHYGAEPDIVVMAKALSGGLIPCSAVLMSDAVYDAVYDSLKRSIVHTSTFSENAMSMRAGLATLDVLERENLGERALALGELLRTQLREDLAEYEMVRDVRGMGLLSGIEFQPPRDIRLRMGYEAFRHIHPGMFGQVTVMRLFRDKNFLTQMCGNNFLVLKAAPPLVATEEHIQRFARAVKETVHQMHHSTSFWSEALGLARRAMNV
ncbi:MAG TPA: aspartate aminotransferase family protein [Bryobacteraceae bacterium]|nr:aspartate aminotransferase family protein [Bryobacteraceae bacterium]